MYLICFLLYCKKFLLVSEMVLTVSFAPIFVQVSCLKCHTPQAKDRYNKLYISVIFYITIYII